MSTITSGGSARNMSTKMTIRALSGLIGNERMTASRRPTKRPVTTTASPTSMVVTTPFRIDGRYCAIRFGLKKVSRKAFMRFLPPPPLAGEVGEQSEPGGGFLRGAPPPPPPPPRGGGGRRPPRAATTPPPPPP